MAPIVLEGLYQNFLLVVMLRKRTSDTSDPHEKRSWCSKILNANGNGFGLKDVKFLSSLNGILGSNERSTPASNGCPTRFHDTE
jgi:hypothetical protein